MHCGDLNPTVPAVAGEMGVVSFAVCPRTWQGKQRSASFSLYTTPAIALSCDYSVIAQEPSEQTIAFVTPTSAEEPSPSAWFLPPATTVIS